MAIKIIAIDPDASKSGFAVVDVAKKQVEEAAALPFPDLLSKIRASGGHNLKVVIEGGWLNRGNWHMHGRMTAAKAAAMGRNVGMNHQTGILLAECVRAMGIGCTVVKPLQKCWRGKDGKITREELGYFTGYDKRTSQDVRDAILIAWVYAGLPVKVYSK